MNEVLERYRNKTVAAHAAMTVLIVVIIGAGSIVLGAFRDDKSSPAAEGSEERERYLVVKDEVELNEAGTPGGAVIIEAETNLPQNTRFSYWIALGDRPWGMGCCDEVDEGLLRVRIPVSECPPDPVLTVSLVAEPVFHDVANNASCLRTVDGHPCPQPPVQPDPVLNELGDRFEKVSGPDVRSRGGINRLVVEKTVDLTELGVC